MDSLFDDSDPPVFCRHGRPVDECVFFHASPPIPPLTRQASEERARMVHHKLARANDPHTSKTAASSLDLNLKVGHEAVLDWLTNWVATDDEIAEAMVALGHAARTETARRWVRTLREVHGLIEPALDENGVQVTRVNRSGRSALAWQARS